VVTRTSLNLDLGLVAEARRVLGTRNTSETVHRALEEVVRREKLRALAAEDFRMSEEKQRSRIVRK
jgi:Arc/MetJ family transcription regulator